MTRVVKSILMRGALDRVFDIVTTAKYWTEWHPATQAVSGAIDQPMQLGDRIRERAKIGGIIAENDWTVVECVRPSRVVLRMPGTALGDLEIAYAFAPRGTAIEFTRTLQFDLTNLPPLFDRAALERQMDSDSDQAVRRLKALVERMLASELLQ